jgi:glycosidase
MQRFMNEPGATVEGLKLAQTFLLTTRGTPLLYYGDELAMPGGGDPDNRRDFPGGFPGDPRSAFTKQGRTAAENDVFEHLKLLTKLRADLPALRRGSLVHLLDEEQQTAYARVLGDEVVIVVINNENNNVPVEFDVRGVYPNAPHRFVDMLGRGSFGYAEDGRFKVAMPPRSAAVYMPRGVVE